jgi:hypothetical protein
MSVLDSWESPYNFVVNGSRHVHAVQRGVRLLYVSPPTMSQPPEEQGVVTVEEGWEQKEGGGGGEGGQGGGQGGREEVAVEIETLDAPLVSFTDIFHLISYDGGRSAARPAPGGVTAAHLNLYNNLWGTAFPQWQKSDAAFRFRVFITLPTSYDTQATLQTATASSSSQEEEEEEDEEVEEEPALAALAAAQANAEATLV